MLDFYWKFRIWLIAQGTLTWILAVSCLSSAHLENVAYKSKSLPIKTFNETASAPFGPGFLYLKNNFRENVMVNLWLFFVLSSLIFLYYHFLMPERNCIQYSFSSCFWKVKHNYSAMDTKWSVQEPFIRIYSFYVIYLNLTVFQLYFDFVILLLFMYFTFLHC